MGKGDRTRQQILQVALNDASQLGLEGLSIGGLAKRTGLSKSGLFAHFGSKRELQLAVIELAAEVFIDTVIRPAITRPRGEPRLRALLENWMTWTQRASLDGGDVLSSTPGSSMIDQGRCGTCWSRRSPSFITPWPRRRGSRCMRGTSQPAWMSTSSPSRCTP